jgi:hypothetical protein
LSKYLTKAGNQKVASPKNEARRRTALAVRLPTEGIRENGKRSARKPKEQFAAVPGSSRIPAFPNCDAYGGNPEMSASRVHREKAALSSG